MNYLLHFSHFIWVETTRQLFISDFPDLQLTCFRNKVYTEQANTKPDGGYKLSDGLTFHIWGLKTVLL